ncbi:MAG: lysylphosphatidylglycerol synthase transmembrane domain-containing protein [Paludibacter sp.]|nr:lysylphosphatidylglycerol synthase transmembrane domain-containing protein [Paludibacter sp.]
MKKFLKLFLIICIVVSFVLFLKGTDIGESVRLIRKLDSGIFYIFLVTFTAYCFGGLALKYCIDADEKPKFPKLFAIKHVGNIISVFNPSGAIAGELFSANVLISNGVSKQVAYKSVLLSRIMMILAQLALLLFVLIWYLFSLSDELPPVLAYIFYGCFAVFFVVVVFILWFLLKPGSENILIHKEEKKWHKIIFQFRELRSSLAEYIHRRPKDALKAYIFYTIHWLFTSLELFIILRFLGYHVTVFDSLFLDTVIVVSKSAVAFIPGQFGAEELINKFALALVRIGGNNLWLSVSILRRVRQLFWSMVAFVLYWILKRQVKNPEVNLIEEK